MVEGLQEKNKDLAIENERFATTSEQKNTTLSKLETLSKDLESQLEKSKHCIQTLQ